MQRREFITLLGGATVTWPLAARAQQADRVRRIGILMNIAADDSVAQNYVGAFMQGLAQLGWSVGRNLRVDLRWGAGDAERIRRYAAELVALSPDVILAAGGPVVIAVQLSSRTVPIGFAQSIDPVGAGYVQSLARPGGNATGFTQFEYSLASKWLELLKEIVPGIKRVGVLRDSTNPAGIGQWAIIQSAAAAVGMTPIQVHDPSEMERGVAAFARESNGGLGGRRLSALGRRQDGGRAARCLAQAL
jgi:putative ABC transport system substrate-binding protein